MRKTRTSIVLALAGLVTSLLTFISAAPAIAAGAAELRWPAVDVSQHSGSYTDPKGGISLGCRSEAPGGRLRTYGSSGQLTRDVPRVTTAESDNCISRPVVDKNGDVYGYSQNRGELLAYSGNTLKWRYATECSPTPTVGADGNIYIAAEAGRLIALSPNVAPGQTQPEKVRDVPLDIPVSCGAEFTAFKDGLWTTDQGRTFYFYSYGGKKLAQFAPARRPIPNAINANGLLIYGHDDMVSAFDPMTNSTKWSINLATLGYATSVADVYATSDGGAVVKMAGTTSDFIKLNAYGNVVKKAWSRTFSSVDSDGNTLGFIDAISNGHGKLVLYRSAQLRTSNPAMTVPAIGIAILDVISGELTYSKTLQGNLDSSNGGLYGLQMSGDPLLGVDTVYVYAVCTGACADTTVKLFPIKVPGMRLDYPRGAVLASRATMQPSAVSYVAMGDSFSSGQGARFYDADTVTDVNKCYKSNYAFGRVLNRDPFSPLMLSSFAACGGAVTDNIDVNTTYPGVAEKQDQALLSNTKVVSLTIGGNDIKFTDVVKGCLTLQCDSSIQAARQELTALPDKLQRVYDDILSKTSAAHGGADAQIYVLGYGPLLSTDASDCVIGDAPFGGENRTKAIALLNDLNKVISDAVTAVGSPRIHYVNPISADSPFAGHSLCTSEPYFNGITLSDTRESFHPNALGQAAYAKLLLQYILEN